MGGRETDVIGKERQISIRNSDVFPIIGGRRVEHLKDNIRALSIKLTDEQIQYLEAVKPFDLGFPSNLLSDPNVEGSSKLLDRTAKLSFPNARK